MKVVIFTLVVALLIGQVASYRLPMQMGLLSRFSSSRRPPKARLPDVMSFSKPSSRGVQAKGWRDSIIQLCRAALPRPTKAQAETIKSVADSLESVNPTPSPALSPYVDGQWKLLYSDSPGVSSGRLGPFTGRVYQDVDLKGKEYVNILEVGKQGEQPWLEARLVASWTVKDDNTWEVLFDKITIQIFGRTFEKKFKNVTRYWVMTYLDQDLRIMRGRRPQRKEKDAYWFVLARDNGVGR